MLFSASEKRDDGKLVKDVARRLQTLRKEGVQSTDVLGVASILDLDEESLMIEKGKIWLFGK